jgi:hypothetical protein
VPIVDIITTCRATVEGLSTESIPFTKVIFIAVD